MVGLKHVVDADWRDAVVLVGELDLDLKVVQLRHVQSHLAFSFHADHKLFVYFA